MLKLPNFLPHDLIDAYVEVRKHQPPGGWSTPTPYQFVPEMRALTLYPPLMAMMKHLISEDMLLHLCLTGWVSTERDWHQDDYLNPPFVNSWYTAVWMALDDIHPDSGPFQYIRGSHRWPLLRGDKVRRLLPPEELEGERWKFWPKTAEAFVTPAVEAEIARRQGETVVYLPKKGDVLIWHGRLMHRGSAPNRQHMERRSLIAHYSGVGHREDMNDRAVENGAAYAVFKDQLPATTM